MPIGNGSLSLAQIVDEAQLEGALRLDGWPTSVLLPFASLAAMSAGRTGRSGCQA